MYLVLDEKVHQRHERPEKGRGQVLPVCDRLRVRRAQRQTTQRPRQGSNQIADHEDIVPIVIIRARDISPPTARQRPKDTNTGYDFRQGRARAIAHAVPEADEDEARPGADGNEDLKDGALGVAVSDCCAHGWEPFDWVGEVFVLDDFGIVEGTADDEGAEEGCVGGEGMGVSYKGAGYLGVDRG